MRTIGLIGGMSWESTATYYRLINEAVRLRRGGLTSARLLLESLDFSEITALQKAGRWDEAARALGGAGERLARIGAHCVLICTNTMHLVAEEVGRAVRVPLIDIIDETAAALKADGRRTPLLLATRYTMEHGFYVRRMASHGIDVVVPDAAGRAVVHDIIFDELCRGRICPRSRERMLAIVADGAAGGADAVILGCTEVQLLLDANALPLPGYDSTAIHSDAAVRFALADGATVAAAA